MPARRGLTPWIEKLIETHDSDEVSRAGGLQAHVVDVGDMSQSQALGSEGPTALLFLSDEHVKIPAVLTARAWEELQENEDVDCFRSLLDHRVCITDYRLLFHMSAEQTRSKFYLSVGKLGTRAAVVGHGINHNVPCCTALPSVQNKIRQTWRAMLGQHDSQKNQSGFNLTDLLGEWQQDCLVTELEQVQKLLSVTPQSSGPTSTLLTTLPNTCAGTGWDKDRVNYKGSKSFTVPVNHLLIPDTSVQLNAQPQTGSVSVGSSKKSGTSLKPTSEHTSYTEVTNKQPTQDTLSPSEHRISALEDVPIVLSNTGMSRMSNAWDMCPPPSNTSSTKSSPPVSPVSQSPTFTESTSNLHPLYTSTQISAHVKGSHKELPTETSLLPPYQRPPASEPPPSSTSTRRSANAPPMCDTVDRNLCTSEQEMAKDNLVRKCSRSVRKSGVPTDEDLMECLENDEEEQVGSSPPSWMLDSLTGSTSEHTVSQTWASPVGALTQVHRHVHDDGKPFSYIYQVKGQELQQFSHFTVGQDMLQWAARYLLKPNHDKHNSTGVSATETKDGQTIIT